GGAAAKRLGDHGRRGGSGARSAAGGAGRMSEPFELGGRVWGSRLILGTGGFRSLEALERALVASGAEIATGAVRRGDPAAREGSVLEVLDRLRPGGGPQHDR